MYPNGKLLQFMHYTKTDIRGEDKVCFIKKYYSSELNTELYLAQRYTGQTLPKSPTYTL